MPDSTLLLGQINIGPTIAGRLAAIGITTIGDLRQVGVVSAYHRLRAHFVGQTLPVCYYLYALQGALDGVHWDALPAATKSQLLAAANRA